MNFPGFTEADFNVFTIPTLEERMTAIRENIQPKFQMLGQQLADELSMQLGQEMFLHIAKHARRKVNPPNDTWLAIGPNKRGYKQYPHFQVGLFDDHLFIWLAYIYELPNKKQMGENLLNHLDQINSTIPSEYVVSVDHMKKGAKPISTVDLKEVLNRFIKVKKAEVLIGKTIAHDDPILQKPEQLINVIQTTFTTLLPIYQISLSA